MSGESMAEEIWDRLEKTIGIAIPEEMKTNNNYTCSEDENAFCIVVRDWEDAEEDIKRFLGRLRVKVGGYWELPQKRFVIPKDLKEREAYKTEVFDEVKKQSKRRELKKKVPLEEEILEYFKECGGKKITLSGLHKKFSKDPIGYEKVLAQMQQLGIVSYGLYDPDTKEIYFEIDWTGYMEEEKKRREKILRELGKTGSDFQAIRGVDETTLIIKEMKEFLKEQGGRVRLKDFIKRFPKEKHEEILTKLHKSGVVAVVGDYVHLLKG